MSALGNAQARCTPSTAGESGEAAPHVVPDEPVVELGTLPYRDAWALQRHLHAERVAGRRRDSLLLLEHPPVVTLGRTGGREFLLGPGPLVHPTLGAIEVVETDRGGKVTYHGPGQLVGYGIVSLDERRMFPAAYVHALEDLLISALARFGLVARAEPGRVGVWIEDRKIASLGVRILSGVSMHGFALNVANDLSPFAMMHPCGLSGVRMTSARAEGSAATGSEVRAVIAEHWRERFPQSSSRSSA